MAGPQVTVEDRIVEFLGPQYTAGGSKLNAGCGDMKLPGWVNLDAFSYQNPDVVADLDYPLPFASSTFDCILCSHTLEHVTSPMRTIAEFNRILKVGGYLIVVVPYGYGNSGLANPLHRNCITEATFEFFLKSTYAKDGTAGKNAHQGMPLGDWHIDRIEMVPYPEFVDHPNLPFLANHCFNIIREVRCVMQKVDPV